METGGSDSIGEIMALILVVGLASLVTLIILWALFLPVPSCPSGYEQTGTSETEITEPDRIIIKTVPICTAKEK